MSYETTEQKELLQFVQRASVSCANGGIAYGKALTAFNLGYGRERSQPTQDGLRAQRTQKQNDGLAAKRAKAKILASMTGLQVRLANNFPAEMLAKVRDDQRLGDVFTLAEIELSL